MNSTFGRRLRVVTTFEIAAVLWLLVIAGALLALGTYVATVRGDVQSSFGRVVAALESDAARHDARVAGKLAASRYPRSSVTVFLIDEKRRVVVFTEGGPEKIPFVDVRLRGAPPAEPKAEGVFGRIVLGLVTAFGVTPLRTHLGTIDVIVRPNDAALVGVVASHVWQFFAALALSVALALALARALTRQVLRPLVDVTEALARFAAGDLTPQTIVADRRHQLGSLAVAYNGAIAQMERAFAERDRANTSMRQFMADAGHQLRTPLTVVRGFISILRKGDLRSPADAERILETMHRQSLVMASLIDKLMLLDRWDGAQAQAAPEKIDVARLVNDVLGPIAESHPSRAVRVDAPEAGLVGIDPMDFTHALTNVVDNALKYTTGAVDVRVRRDDGAVLVDIVDEGPGMSPAEAAHAFDRFFRGSRRDVDGSGLGLAIARRAVERAGGTLAIESDPVAGSRFRIALPVARDETRAISSRV